MPKHKRKYIPQTVLLPLWILAGGRCEFDGCNKPLLHDVLTKTRCNLADVAHIIASSPNGPRGDDLLSDEKSIDLSNLMLLCKDHHKMVDEYPDIYTVEVLQNMKKTHEETIEYLTSLKNKGVTHIVVYTADIGNNIPRINFEHTICAVLPEYYPKNNIPIELSCINNAYKDYEDKFWEYEREQLNRKFESNIKKLVVCGEIKHISVFALAPQPLLIELGRLLSDINFIEIYQKHREPNTWKWLENNEPIDFILEEPKEIFDKVALNLSLSGVISNDRITSVLGDETSIWTISVSNPNNDIIKTREQLSSFRIKMREVYNKIKSVHGQNNKIHVFPACPVSAAIEIGRVWMPKADLPLVLYDQNNIHKKFVHAFDID